jgi:WD40 repeat protein
MKARLLTLVLLFGLVAGVFAQKNYLVAPNITADNAADVTLATTLSSDVEWLEILDIAINAQERYMAVWGFDATTDVLEIWDLSTGEPVNAIRPEGLVLAMDFADSSTVAAAMDTDVVLYDVVSGEETDRFSFEGEVVDLVFSPDGSDFVVFTEATNQPGLMEVFDMESGEVLFSLPADDIYEAVYSAATTLYTANIAEEMTRFDRVDIASGEVTEGMYEYDGEIDMMTSRQTDSAHIAISDGVMLTTFTPNNLDEDEGYMLDFEGEVESAVTAMTYSRDGQLLYVAFANQLYILETETGETLHIAEWDDEFDEILSLAAGNKVIAAAGATYAGLFSAAEATDE